MKTLPILCVLLSIFLVACKSKKTTPPPPPPPVENEVNHDEIIRTNYPPVNFDKVPPLKSLADFPIGMEVAAADEERSIFKKTEQQEVLKYHFNSLVAGVIMKMRYLHPEENSFTFADADKLVKFAEDNNMLMHGHTLIWHWDSEIPAWMKAYSGDWNTMMHNHVYEIVSHYKGRVKSWDVVNEAIDTTSPTTADYRKTIFFDAMGKEYIENAFVSARQADSQTELYYNDYSIEDNGAKLQFTLNMIDDFIKRKIPIDGIGFQMHTDINWPPIGAIKASFAAAAARNIKVKITELDIAVNRKPEAATYLTGEISLLQKERYKQIVKVYLEAVPPAQRGGITIWGLVDGETWMRQWSDRLEWPLLFHDNFSVKPALYGISEALSGK